LDITLIRPKSIYNKTFFGWRLVTLPPLNLLMIASSTPRDINIRILDEYVGPITLPPNTDIIGITIPTSCHAYRAYEIADMCRNNGKYVVLGGMHASVLPEEALQHADTVFRGESEKTWPEFLKDYQARKPKKNYKMESPQSLDDLPVPRRELIDYRKYYFPIAIQVTRGCPRRCTYCSISMFNESIHRYRPIEAVVEEVRPYKGKFIPILDDNLFGNIDYAKKLMEAFIPLKFKWGTQVPVECFRDKELLDLSVKSGCKHVFSGLESISLNSLNEAKRKGISSRELKKLLRSLAEKGINVFIHFIFGFDNDTVDVFENTCDYAREIGVPFGNFHILTPYPGTDLYKKMAAENRLLTKDWSRYDARHVVFQPKNMSPVELQKGFTRAWRKLYSFGSIYSRLRLNRQFTRKNLIFSLGYKYVIAKVMTYN
jgi:radical SAM superfamily enzyme YgiQ (UPF0313 family)